MRSNIMDTRSIYKASTIWLSFFHDNPTIAAILLSPSDCGDIVTRTYRRRKTRTKTERVVRLLKDTGYLSTRAITKSSASSRVTTSGASSIHLTMTSTKHPDLELVTGYFHCDINQALIGVSSWTNDHEHSSHAALEDLEALSSFLDEDFGPNCALENRLPGYLQIPLAAQQNITTLKQISNAITKHHTTKDTNSTNLQELNKNYDTVENHLSAIINHLRLCLESRGDSRSPVFRSVVDTCDICTMRLEIEAHLDILCGYTSVAQG